MPNEKAVQFCRKFAEAAADVLKQLTGKEYSVETNDAGRDENLKYALRLKSRKRAEKQMVVRYGSDSFKLFGEALLGQKVEDESSAEAVETVVEAWRQIVGRANSALASELDGDELEVVEETVGNRNESVGVGFRLTEGAVFQFRAELSPGFFSRGDEVETPSMHRSVAVGGACDHQNLDLLLEIPLSVTLRFGERRMALRNILELSSGAVLELDRHADDPVDLCLDERVIARGQVVVVDGCYGLRVTQICRQMGCSVAAGAQG